MFKNRTFQKQTLRCDSEMPLKAPIAFFDNSLSYGSSIDEELIELTAHLEAENDDTDEDDAILDHDDNEFIRSEIEEQKRQKKNCKIYQVISNS